jgi:hypothetical protein
MPLFQSALELVGTVVVAGGGLSLIIFQVFKHFGEKWLESKFEQRLQDLRHQHERELEHLRFRINALLDRTTKRNEREFEILPEAWGRLHAAFWKAYSDVSPMQSFPDIERMVEAELDDFLGKSDLKEWQRAELRGHLHKNRYYQEQITWHRSSQAISALTDTNIYLAQVGIFMQEPIRAAFTELVDSAYMAATEHRLNLEHKPVPRIREKTDAFLQQGEARLDALGKLVHARLWPEERNAA